MKKKIIFVTLFLFSLMHLFFGQEKTSLFVESNGSNGSFLQESLEGTEMVTPYKIVNMHNEATNPKQLFASHNTMIQAYYHDERFPLQPLKEPGVCVLDAFSPVDTFGFKSSHGDFVSKMLNKRYIGDILQFDVSDVSYRNYHFSECDVINYSMSIHE